MLERLRDEGAGLSGGVRAVMPRPLEASKSVPPISQPCLTSGRPGLSPGKPAPQTAPW